MDRNGKPSIRRRGWLGWLFNSAARLAVWYMIVTVVFRCPPSRSDITASSPQVCTSYFDTKDRITPIIEPHYQAYISPYIDVSRPYYENFQSNFYIPITHFVLSNYEQYAAPSVLYMQDNGQHQWNLHVKPKLDVIAIRAATFYDQSLRPYATQLSQNLAPFAEKAQIVGVYQYQSVILPVVSKARPYLWFAYAQIYTFTTEVGLPYSYWLGKSTASIVQRRVWPQIRILYGENIQPQLAKIQERLASYKDGKRLEQVVESVDATLSSRLPASSFTSYSPTSSPVSSSPGLSTSAETMGGKGKLPATSVEDYAGELRAWKEKFSKAADRGAADLYDRMTAITDKQIEQQARGTGEALLTALDDVTMRALEEFKPEVLNLIRDMSHGDDSPPTDEETDATVEKAKLAVRNVGKRIKDAAQRLRAWRKKYNEETENLINTATESTLEVVDNIRDLGLQEIGMRWATLDGVSYKDWSEYHEMKKSFADWRDTVQKVVDTHKGPEIANAAGEDVESRGMVIAENAARELVRLKDVALWKVEAHDIGEDFSTRYSPPGAVKAARRAKQKIMSASSDYLDSSTSSQDVVDSIMSEASSLIETVSEKAATLVDNVSDSASSLASSSIETSDASSTISKVLSVSDAAAEAVYSAASSVVSGGADSVSIASTNAALRSAQASLAALAASKSTVSASILPAFARSMSSGLDAIAAASSQVSNEGSTTIAKAKTSLASIKSSLRANAEALSSPSMGVSAMSSVAMEASDDLKDAIVVAPADASSAVSRLAQSSKSVSSKKNKLKSSATSASSKSSMQAPDIIDTAGAKASSASSSIASKVADAGEDYADVTSKLEL